MLVELVFGCWLFCIMLWRSLSDYFKERFEDSPPMRSSLGFILILKVPQLLQLIVAVYMINLL